MAGAKLAFLIFAFLIHEPRTLIGGDTRFMDILQRFRPATCWNVMAKRIGKASKRKND